MGHFKTVVQPLVDCAQEKPEAEKYFASYAMPKDNCLMIQGIDINDIGHLLALRNAAINESRANSVRLGVRSGGGELTALSHGLLFQNSEYNLRSRERFPRK